MIDPDDPLAGRDPYPRTLVDTLGLDLARLDLLEEIVSTPGPTRQPTSTRTRVLIALGVAAALVIIGGGTWALTSGDHARDDTHVAAAPVTSTAPSATATARDDAHRAGVSSGKVGRECQHLASRRSQLRQALSLLERRTARKLGGRWVDLYAVRSKGGRRLVAVDRQCRVRYLRSLGGR